MKKTIHTTPVVFVILIGIFCGLASQSWAIDEPNGIVGACYMTSVSSEEEGEDCPSWSPAIDRRSTDAHTNLYLKVEIDGCYYTHYDVYTVEQKSNPEPISLEENDVFLVWDEDANHGSTEDFTFTNDNYIEITDPNTQCPYVRISSHPSNNIINWKLYRVTANGTLTIDETQYNEHDAIHFHNMRFRKYDDVDTGECRSPGDSIEYTICFEGLDEDAVYEDAYIIDYLDDGVDYVNAGYTAVYDGNSFEILPPDPGYYDEGRYYVWQIGEISEGDANCVTLDVEVNYTPVPDSIIHNVAELWGMVYDPNGNPEYILLATATEDTLVCCWGDDPNIIYVDKNATGTNIGISWQNAYTDLADALRRATDSDCSAAYSIYIAEGEYNPENTLDETFELPDYCSVYGGFPAGGCPFEDRNPKKYETILTGLIDEQTLADTVVTMGNECLLSGITATKASLFGQCIYGDSVDFTIEDSVVKESYEYGIYAKNGNVNIKRCTINSNGRDGIRHEGEGKTLTVENSWLLRNGENGLHSRNSTPTVKNSIVSESSLVNFAFAGVRMYRPANTPKLYNCTISNNRAEGVYFEDTGIPDLPMIRNCIIYYNNAENDGVQMSGLVADNVAFNCCIADCNEVNDNHNGVPGFAYTIDPNGTPNPANYHLLSDALCVDEGDSTYSDIDDNDYDGEIREMGSSVDIGADEVNPDCGDVSHPLDFDADGIVNLNEFSLISQVWMAHDPNDPVCDPNHPDYVSDPNATGYITPSSLAAWYPDAPTFNFVATGDSEYVIDLADLMYFCEDDPQNWLWIACYKLEQMQTAAAQSQSQSFAMASMSLSSYSLEAQETIETVEAEPEASIDALVQIIGILEYEIIPEQSDNVEDLEELKADLMDDLREAWLRENQ